MQKLLLVVVAVLVLSCHEQKKTSVVLSEEQLSSLLVDIYIAEARLDAMGSVKDTTIKYFLPFEKKLLEKRGISDSVLQKTYEYYFAHPKELEKIYDVVIDTLVLREKRATPKLSVKGPNNAP